MKGTRAALGLAAAAALLPGCYFARHAIPTDPSGMEFPVRVVGNQFKDQVRYTGEHVTGLPSAFAGHLKYCWKNLTTDPRDY